MAALKAGDFDIIGYSVIMDSTDALAYLAPFATMYSGRPVSISLDAKSYTPGYTNLDDAEYDALIDKATYTADPAARAQALHDAEAKLVDLCPATMLFYYTNSYVANSSLKSIGDADYFGSFGFIDASLKNWREINAKEDAESAALEEANAKE
jgi:ABC-type oligopeptide transport system substrate-binding subunit